MTYHGTGLPKSREYAVNCSANTWNRGLLLMGVTGYSPLGPSYPSRVPCPPATKKAPIFPPRSNSSPRSAHPGRAAAASRRAALRRYMCTGWMSLGRCTPACSARTRPPAGSSARRRATQAAREPVPPRRVEPVGEAQHVFLLGRGEFLTKRGEVRCHGDCCPQSPRPRQSVFPLVGCGHDAPPPLPGHGRQHARANRRRSRLGKHLHRQHRLRNRKAHGRGRRGRSPDEQPRAPRGGRDGRRPRQRVRHPRGPQGRDRDTARARRYDGVFMTAAVADYKPQRMYEVVEAPRRSVNPGSETWRVRNAQAGKVRARSPRWRCSGVVPKSWWTCSAPSGSTADCWSNSNWKWAWRRRSCSASPTPAGGQRRGLSRRQHVGHGAGRGRRSLPGRRRGPRMGPQASTRGPDGSAGHGRTAAPSSALKTGPAAIESRTSHSGR